MTISVEQFLSTSTTQASVRPPLMPPTDQGYLALISAVDLKDFVYKKGDRAGQTGYRMVLTWDVQDPSVIEACRAANRSAKINQSVMLNLTPDGALAAENTGLKMVREALGQNKDGQPWAPSMMIGQPAKIMVGHRIDDKGEMQEEVTKVASAQ